MSAAASRATHTHEDRALERGTPGEAPPTRFGPIVPPGMMPGANISITTARMGTSVGIYHAWPRRSGFVRRRRRLARLGA